LTSIWPLTTGSAAIHSSRSAGHRQQADKPSRLALTCISAQPCSQVVTVVSAKNTTVVPPFIDASWRRFRYDRPDHTPQL
jgi:hypothetical protein